MASHVYARLVPMLLLVAALAIGGIAAETSCPPRRAKPPVWPQDVLDAFFVDVRVNNFWVSGRQKRPTASARVARRLTSGRGSAEAVSWSKSSGESLAAEVKRIVADSRATLCQPR